MGFFSDLKEDLSLAVNGLMPEEALRVPIPEKETLTDTESENNNKEENPLKAEAVIKAGVDGLTETAKSVAGEQSPVGQETLQLSEEQKNEEQKAEARKPEEQVAKSSAVEEKCKEDSSAESIIPDGTSIIAAGMTIAGDITSQSSVDVKGCVNGNIDIQGKLNITGHITGNSKAPEIVVSKAMVNGELESTGTVYIETGSVVIGNIIATGAVVSGAIKGDLDVKGAVILESSAIVKGNIKSKSVQMNSGAVIEGICSQCYADVSPTAFFDDYRPEIKK